MKIQWTAKASSNLVRLYAHLSPVAPDAAKRLIQQLARAPDRLLNFPRIGEKLEAYEPREVRRILRAITSFATRFRTQQFSFCVSGAAVKTVVSNSMNERLLVSQTPS